MSSNSKFAQKLIQQMKDHNVQFAEGLTERQVDDIETTGALKFPPDLRALLLLAVPIAVARVSYDGIALMDDRFPNWHVKPEKILASLQEKILDSFRFDVERNDFWMKEWGEKPDNLEKAFAIVERELKRVPRLFPVYGHRYIPCTPELAGNPIFSMVQPTDVIYYGSDLENYIENDFLGQEWSVDYSECRNIPFWSKLVG